MEPQRFEGMDADRIATMTEAELDALPFGILELDGRGTVMRINRTEGEIVGYDPASAVGKNFFTDIAPCADTPAFRGRFDQGVASGELKSTFEYRYDGQRKASVWVHMMGRNNRFFVMAKRIG